MIHKNLWTRLSWAMILVLALVACGEATPAASEPSIATAVKATPTAIDRPSRGNPSLALPVPAAVTSSIVITPTTIVIGATSAPSEQGGPVAATLPPVPPATPTMERLIPIPSAVPTALPGGASNYPLYGHDLHWGWIAGQFLHTAIQGGCDFVIFDPSGSGPYGGRVNLVANYGLALRNKQMVVVFGYFPTGPEPMCPGAAYLATSALTR